MEKPREVECNTPKLNDRFRSPDIPRRNLTEESVAAHSGKKSRRTRSNEPVNYVPEDGHLEEMVINSQEEQSSKRWSHVARSQETMSKQELINSYRLLMNEKLRLERFLSIMTKNNEMARNRLESDLLDAMMCIEDLKQALEIRMARRRKIDPREAEERRYLIRQNKKLLNQIYESAKKIERLETTKIEMSEQLELLDFQIVEIENQKNMIEEEMRKIPPTIHEEIQTEECPAYSHQLTSQLKEQLGTIKAELSNQKAETAAALAKQSHLENVIRELRRDNIDLRDQLNKIDDVENSLAESDKPIVADVLLLKGQLDEQIERVKELEEKLAASRLYTDKLESKIGMSNSKSNLQLNSHSMTPNNEAVNLKESTITLNGVAEEIEDELIKQSPLFDSIYTMKMNAEALPGVDSILLKETITTFQALLHEKEQEIAQLKQYCNAHRSNSNCPILPKLFETMAQTDITVQELDQLSLLADNLMDGAQMIPSIQYKSMLSNVKRCEQTLRSILTQLTIPNDQIESTQFELEEDKIITASTNTNTTTTNNNNGAQSNLELSNFIKSIRHLTEYMKLSFTVSDIKLHGAPMSTCSCMTNSEDDENAAKLKLQIELLQSKLDKLHCGSSITEERFIRGNIGEFHLSHSSPSHFLSTTSGSVKDKANNQSGYSPNYYSVQLQELKQTGDLELARAHLSLSERRRHELERRITEVTDELARARAEARSAETSLSAARRTEVALRRRLLVAMNLQNINEDQKNNNLVRHSLGATLGENPEILDIIELQSNLAKLQSTNTSLTEAAQLDRAKLHEQAMRIDQLESELRSQHHRIAQLQATETNAQRGIVRLQALYEDMLREYSESKSTEIEWAVSRQRNSNKKTILPRDSNLNDSTSHSTTNGETLVKNKFSSIPVGSCISPPCIAIRHLLKAFQGRYSELINQLQQIQESQTKSKNECKKETNGDSNHGHDNRDNKIQNFVTQTPELIDELNKHLNKIVDICQYTKVDTAQPNMRYELFKNFKLCSHLIKSLECWLVQCLQQTDSENVKLRSDLLKMQLTAINGQNELTFHNKDDSVLPYFPGETNKKPDVGQIILNEREIFELRERLRQTEAKLKIQIAYDGLQSNHIH